MRSVPAYNDRVTPRRIASSTGRHTCASRCGRWTAAPSRSTPEPVDGDDVEALRKELRRLRGEVVRLEDDKRELERRLGFMQLELERARAKAPRGMSTS